MLRRWFGRFLDSRERGMTEEAAARFEEEALSHLDSLYRTALRLTRNAQDAEDLVQETYLKVFRFADRFEQGTNLRAWMFKILTNSFLNRYRKASQEPKRASLDETEETYIYNRLLATTQSMALSPSAEEAALAQIIDVDVKRALDDLPEEFRMAVLLRDVEGFSYREIAEVTGVPLGTVMSRLSRGRKLLQRSLWEYAQGPGGQSKATVS